VARYQKRISGPLLERIDIHVKVPRVDSEKLSGQRLGEPSHSVRERVAAARQVQARRFKGTRLLTNKEIFFEASCLCGKNITRIANQSPIRVYCCRHDR
jgi:predicted ATPase with chaperone activity